MSELPSRVPNEPHAHEPTHRPWIAAALVAGVAFVLLVALLGLPREGTPLPSIARYAMRVALPRWHTTEPVNEVVYGTRGFDTFGETFLLLAAVVSVVTLTRHREERPREGGEQIAARREQRRYDPRRPSDAVEQLARAAEMEEDPERGVPSRPETPDAIPLGTPGPEHAETMTIVARTAARVAAPVLAIAGLYLVSWGYAPGGGFPAGAVVLGVVLLLYATFGDRRVKRVVRPQLVEAIELLGALAIIVNAGLGLVLRGSFTANYLPLGPVQSIRSGGVLQAFSGSELVEVATGLILAVFSLLAMRHDWAPDRDE
jgi:multicomponent Na+:H+ antiporter subunit B